MKTPINRRLLNRRYYERNRESRRAKMREYNRMHRGMLNAAKYRFTERMAWYLVGQVLLSRDMREAGLHVLTQWEMENPVFHFVYRGRSRKDWLEAL